MLHFIKKPLRFYGLTLAFLIFVQNVRADGCYVTRESDRVASDGTPSESDNFRSQILEVNQRQDSKDDCDVLAGSADEKAGFDDAIYFITDEFAADPADAVDNVTLTSTDLTIKPYRDVKLGNSSKDMLEDATAEFPSSSYSADDYEDDYTNNIPGIDLPQSDMVVINGRSANLKCSAENGGYVYLSNLIVLASAGERMNQGCWKNAGNAYICDGELKGDGDPTQYADPNGDDYLKWCDSDTVREPVHVDFECVEYGTFSKDADGDGYGDASQQSEICIEWLSEEIHILFMTIRWPIYADLESAAFDGLVQNGDDCNDADNQINPDATELCDEIDNNCSGSADENFTNLSDACSVGVGSCADSGVYECSADGLNVECNAAANSPITETCNSADDDCDGQVDEDDVCVVTPTTETFCDDFDGDGAPVDNDLDGASNCDDSDCALNTACTSTGGGGGDGGTDGGSGGATCSRDSAGVANCYDSNCWAESDCVLIVVVDQDGDGVTIQDGDCNDEIDDSTSKQIFPDAVELCDSIDNNCDNQIDENDICVDFGESDPEAQSGCSCDLKSQRPHFAQWPLLVAMSLILTGVLALRKNARLQKSL